MGKKGVIKKLDYKKKKKEIVNFLDSRDNAIMVLATSSNDRVIARNVLIASKGLDLYLFTWGHSRKCKQIRENPRVALCKDDMQIEGSAEILGALREEKNKEYADILRNKFPDSVKKWENLPGMVIIRIRPTLIATASEIISDQIYLEYLDLENGKVYAKQWAYY
jgi:general stress protein 26